MNKKISIIGAGSWGTSLSILLHNNHHSVKVYSNNLEELNEIQTTRINSSKLPNITIPEDIIFTSKLEDALDSPDILVFVVPSQVIRNVAHLVSTKLHNTSTTLVCCSKGIEASTGKLLSQVISEELPHNPFCVLSGPSHAEEVAIRLPTAVVAASENITTSKEIQSIFMNDTFRVYTSTDVIGVEIAGAIKNILALCAGISDGLGYGDNTKAALMTRGLAEISRLGSAMGAKESTFLGLAGIGDVIVTCTSKHSRNNRAGNLIGQGYSLSEALNKINMVVEGAEAVKIIQKLSDEWKVAMPICNEAYKVLYQQKCPKEAVQDLMMRKKKDELL